MPVRPTFFRHARFHSSSYVLRVGWCLGSSPTNNATVGTSVHYVASASSSCAKGVSAIGIYTADNALAHVTNGSKLDTTLNLNPGKYQTTVQEWDNCGGSDRAQVTINVTAEGGVNVASPIPNSTVSSPVKDVATASTGCSKGVTSVGISYRSQCSRLHSEWISSEHPLNLNPGTYNTTVQSWDHCGGTAKTPVSITVATSSSQTGVTVGSGQQFNGYLSGALRGHCEKQLRQGSCCHGNLSRGRSIGL